MMSDQDFDEQVRLAAEAKQRGDAESDQILSRLFNGCGWTQDRIARKMRRTQRWVSYRLTFGAFLSFRTARSNPEISTDSLTEFAFRKLWSQTKGKEQERFEQVAELLKERKTAPLGYRNMIQKPNYRRAIYDQLVDGKWHRASQIIASIQKDHPEFNDKKLSDNIRFLLLPRKGKKVVPQGRGDSRRYRLVKAESHFDPAQARTLELYEQIKPLIDEIEFWGTRHRAEVSVPDIRAIGFRLKKVFDSILQPEHA